MRIWIHLFFNVDSEMAIHINADPDPRILLIVKVMQICDHCEKYTGPPGLYFEPPRLHCERQRPSMAPFEPQKLLNFDFNNADPDTAFHSIAEPGPAS